MTLDVDAVRSSRSRSMSHKIERSRGSWVYAGGGGRGRLQTTPTAMPDESVPGFMVHRRHSQLACTNATATRASLPHRSGG
jgi:hypothetical protein